MNDKPQFNYLGLLAVLVVAIVALSFSGSGVDALVSRSTPAIPDQRIAQTQPSIQSPPAVVAQVATDGREPLPRTINTPFGPVTLTDANGGTAIWQDVSLHCGGDMGIGVPQDKMAWWGGLSQNERLNIDGICRDRGAW